VAIQNKQIIFLLLFLFKIKTKNIFVRILHLIFSKNKKDSSSYSMFVPRRLGP